MEIQKYISSIDFPISKDGLVNFAKEHEAPEEMISMFEKFTDKEYRDEDEVTEEASKQSTGGVM